MLSVLMIHFLLVNINVSFTFRSPTDLLQSFTEFLTSKEKHSKEGKKRKQKKKKKKNTFLIFVNARPFSSWRLLFKLNAWKQHLEQNIHILKCSSAHLMGIQKMSVRCWQGKQKYPKAGNDINTKPSTHRTNKLSV